MDSFIMLIIKELFIKIFFDKDFLFKANFIYLPLFELTDHLTIYSEIL